MRKKIVDTIIYGISITLLVSAAAFFVDMSSMGNRMGNFLVNIGIIGFDEGVSREQRERVNAVYNPSFMFARSRVETAMTYIPIFEINDLPVAEQFARDFSMPLDSITNTDNAFIFSHNGRTLTVYKYLNYVVYLIERGASTDYAETISKEDATRIGLEFMRGRNLPLKYNEVVVNAYGGTFVVSYVSKLSGLLNYAFPTIIEMDKTGAVFSVEYYFFEFERLAQCNLKTMRQAYYELPVDFPADTRIDLKRATLVYFFENSILQPAYLFEGEFEGGGRFRAFVNAARF